MDFFEAQERARQRTKRLVLLFVLAVAGTVAAGYIASWAILNYAGGGGSYRRDASGQRVYVDSGPRPLFDPKLLLMVTGATVSVVGLASLFKWSQMRAGGSAIAEMAGGRAVDLKTTDLRERRLLNVVEEMSIASGIPMPAVYVLDNEPGLNAFAAGLTTSDAAVAVTQGTLEKLTRDELQGVIGHEFSHILNGDMRLNVRITAIVFGILVIGLLGRGILRGLFHGRVRSSGSGKNKGNGAALIVAIGVALLIIGYVGFFFGRLIQAAVSRQREFLADASAVQFTRNPGGITGALKKIGGYALGGSVTSRHADELGHFFFAQAFKSNFGGLWATHPPLDERIRAVEPNWDGKLFEPEEVVDIKNETFATAGFAGGPRYSANETLQRVHDAQPDLPPRRDVTPVPFKPAAVVADIGALTESHFRHAQQLLDSIPVSLRQATRDPQSAQVLVYGLLLGNERAGRDQQQALVEKHAGADAAAMLKSQRPALSIVDPAARLPLLQLALPALRQLDATAVEKFAHTLDELVHVDAAVTPFEYAAQKMLLRQLRLANEPKVQVQYDSFSAVRQEIGVVLSALAHLDAADAAGAFAQGAAQIPTIRDQLALLPADQCGLPQVDAALDKLAHGSLPLKQRLLVAAGHVIGADGTITMAEGDLFRALTATLDCPMPALGQSA